VQSITEDGGYIQCAASEESANAGYQGEQPDFGSGPSAAPVGVDETAVAPRSAPAARKPAVKHGKRKSPSAKRAAVTTCTLTADVSLVYAIA
jgi:hypothetical protein